MKTVEEMQGIDGLYSPMGYIELKSFVKFLSQFVVL